MAEPQYAHNHVINPETGFLENPAYASQFDSARKQAFLELYKQNGIRLRRTCRSMGLSEDTVNRHLHTDPLFKKLFDDVEKDYLEDLEATSRDNALNPKSVIERIFQLKCLIPEKYGQENKPANQTVNITIDSELLSRVAQRTNVIEAEIISTQLEAAKTLDNQQSESANNPVKET